MSILVHSRLWVQAAGLGLAVLLTGCYPATETSDEPAGALDQARESVRLPDRQELGDAVESVAADASDRLQLTGWAPMASDIDLSDRVSLRIPEAQPMPPSQTEDAPEENNASTLPEEPQDEEPDTSVIEPVAAEPAPEADPEPSQDPVAEETLDDGRFPERLSICPMMNVSNAPSTDGLAISSYEAVIDLESGPALAVAPVETGCLSSGFGPRSGSLHKGIDIHNARPTAIYAAADGTVRAQRYRDDYGNMIVIDHGDGWFTRYAHLSAFESGISVGTEVRAGETIGQMGNTASYPIPIHLHYEVLTGEWGDQAGSFALDAVDILSYLPAN